MLKEIIDGVVFDSSYYLLTCLVQEVASNKDMQLVKLIREGGGFMSSVTLIPSGTSTQCAWSVALQKNKMATDRFFVLT